MEDNTAEKYGKFFEHSYNHLIKKMINPAPTIIFFGAGASFGSDNSRLVKIGKLPPLGKDLYEHLVNSPEIEQWKLIPKEAIEIFKDNFELGLCHIMDNDEKYKMFYNLLIELGLYFSKFKPEKNNLYEKLTRRQYKAKRYITYITLNYDALLQHSIKNNGLFPHTIGVQQRDLIFNTNKVFPVEVIYPHGACQFNWRCPKSWDGEFYNGTMELAGGGLTHFYHKDNIVRAYTKTKEYVRCMPLMCAYEPYKRPFGKNYFIDIQREYYAQAVKTAKQIILVGVNCNYENDTHIWSVLSQTDAEIIFIEPSTKAIEKIKKWNNNLQIINKTFKDAFEDICKFAQI